MVSASRCKNKKYRKKVLEDPLPRLPEDERIYFDVPYSAKDFAQYSRCGFDSEKKLWFTGKDNANLRALVDLYSVNGATSPKGRRLLYDKLHEDTEV